VVVVPESPQLALETACRNLFPAKQDDRSNDAASREYREAFFVKLSVVRPRLSGKAVSGMSFTKLTTEN
jgi:hypothetical protein